MPAFKSPSLTYYLDCLICCYCKAKPWLYSLVYSPSDVIFKRDPNLICIFLGHHFYFHVWSLVKFWANMTKLPTRKAGKAAGGWSPSWIKPTLNSSGLVLHRCWYKTQEFKKSIWRQFITTLSTPQSQWVLNFTIRQTVCQIPLLCLVPNTEYLLSLLLKSSQMWALSVFVIKYSLSLF